MPWATNAELPPRVRSVLPAAAQTRFRNVANACMSKGDDDKSAIKQAWSVVANGWEKGDSGQWVRKMDLAIEKAAPRTLYVCRYVQNGADIVKWAKAQGFEATVPADEMHVTLVFSRKPVDWMKASSAWGGDDKGNITIPEGGPRLVEPLGTDGAVVLLFGSSELTWRNEAILRDTAASSDYPGYQPHVTISYNAKGMDLSKVEPYNGKIVLGPEIFKELDTGWKDRLVEKHDLLAKFQAVSGGGDIRVVKVDPGLGLVFGWAVICKHDGKDYFDLNRDQKTGELVPEHIPEGAMLKAAADFMENSRVHKEMHDGDARGTVVFAFPMTSDIAKSLKIETNGTTGLLVAMKPDPAMLAKYKSGELTGFSIGGSRQKLREIEG